MEPIRAFKLSIETENAAFDPDPMLEVARILRALAKRLEIEGASGLYQNLRDSNGNVVGTFKAVPAEGPFSETQTA